MPTAVEILRRARESRADASASDEQGRTYARGATGTPQGGQFAKTAGAGQKKPAPKAHGKPAPRPAPKPAAKPAAKKPAPKKPTSLDEAARRQYANFGAISERTPAGDQRVKDLQTLMAGLGIKVAPDGKFGPQTTAAVKALQTKLGRKPTGRVTSSMLHTLQSAAILSPCARATESVLFGAAALMVRAQEAYNPDQLRAKQGTGIGGRWVSMGAVVAALKGKGHHDAAASIAHLDAPSGHRTPGAHGIARARPRTGGHDKPTADAIHADHRETLGRLGDGHGDVQQGDALAAARAHVADMQTKAGGTPSAPSAPHPDAHAIEQENRVRAAYVGLQKEPGGWVGLADIRAALPDMSREDQDAALKRLAMGQFGPSGSRVIPIANSKGLSEADRAAALHMGGQDHHALSIKDPSPLPMSSAPSHAGAPSAPSAPAKKSAAAKMAKKTAARKPTRAALAKDLERGAQHPLTASALRRTRGNPAALRQGAETDESQARAIEDGRVQSRPDLGLDAAGYRRIAAEKRSFADRIEREAAAPKEQPDIREAPTLTQQERVARRVAAGYSEQPTEKDARAAAARLTRPQAIVLAERFNVGGRSTNSLTTEDLKSRLLVDEVVGHALRTTGSPDSAYAEIVDGSLDIKPAPSAPRTAAAKMTRAKAAKPPVTPDMLRNATSPDDIAPHLEGRTAADLRQIAADAGIHVGSKYTKDQLKQTIMQHGVQRRLNSHAVTGPGVGSPAAPLTDRQKLSAQRAAIKAHRAENERGRAAANETMVGGDLGSIDALARAVSRGSGGSSTPAKKSSSPATPKAAAMSPDPAVRAVQVDNRVRAAYAAVLSRSSNPGNRWVGLADLRNELGEGVNRHEVDAALRRLIQTDGVNVVPESNQKTLRQADRDSSVVIGDQNKHLLTIADPSPRPLPSVAPTKTTTAAQKMTRGKAAAEPTSSILTRLRAAVTRGDAEAILAGMSMADLRGIARAAGISPGRSRAAIIEALVENAP